MKIYKSSDFYQFLCYLEHYSHIIGEKNSNWFLFKITICSLLSNFYIASQKILFKSWIKNLIALVKREKPSSFFQSCFIFAKDLFVWPTKSWTETGMEKKSSLLSFRVIFKFCCSNSVLAIREKKSKGICQRSDAWLSGRY